MKILVYCINYAPEMTGVAKYTSEMCVWLAKNGHNVSVITGQPYYPEWKVHKGYKAYRYKKEVVDGVKLYRCPLYVPENPSGLKRIIHLLSFAFFSFPFLILYWFKQPHLFFFVEPTFTTFPGSILFSKLSSCKSILHIQDFEIEAGVNLIFNKLPMFGKLIFALEKLTFNSVTWVSTISDKMCERLSHKGVEESRILKLPNWVDLDAIYPLEGVNSYRNLFNPDGDKRIALYSGNLGEKQGLELVIDLAKSKLGSNWLFVICGNGAAESRLKLMSKGLDNIIWRPLQPIEKLNELLNCPDIHLLPQRADAADLVMPSKLTGILASGKPVVATALPNTEVYNIVSEYGFVVPPNDLETLRGTLDDYEDIPEKFVSQGLKGRKYAEDNLSINSILNEFSSTILTD